MPTAARLMGALLFAALAWVLSDMIVPLMPEGTQFGHFHKVNLAIGALCGWQIMGSRVGSGYQAGATVGLTAGLSTVVVCLLIHSIVVMIDKSMALRYDGPMEGVADVFNLAFEHGLIMATPAIGAVLFAGSMIAGVITEWTGRRWA